METLRVRKVSVASRPDIFYLNMIQEESNSHIANRILEQALKLFIRYGVRSITLDEIASELGISKKTIYQHFKNKADIVHAFSMAYMKRSEVDCGKICDGAENAIDELIGYMQWMVNEFKAMSPTLAYEVQKYYPKSWKVFQHHENEFIMGKMKDNLKRGIEEGLYRKGLDIELISRIRIAQIDTAFDPQIFPTQLFSPVQVHKEMLHLYMRGIVTEKGRVLMEKYMGTAYQDPPPTHSS